MIRRLVRALLRWLRRRLFALLHGVQVQVMPHHPRRMTEDERREARRERELLKRRLRALVRVQLGGRVSSPVGRRRRAA